MFPFFMNYRSSALQLDKWRMPVCELKAPSLKYIITQVVGFLRCWLCQFLIGICWLHSFRHLKLIPPMPTNLVALWSLGCWVWVSYIYVCCFVYQISWLQCTRLFKQPVHALPTHSCSLVPCCSFLLTVGGHTVAIHVQLECELTLGVVVVGPLNVPIIRTWCQEVVQGNLTHNHKVWGAASLEHLHVLVQARGSYQTGISIRADMLCPGSW